MPLFEDKPITSGFSAGSWSGQEVGFLEAYTKSRANQDLQFGAAGLQNSMEQAYQANATAYEQITGDTLVPPVDAPVFSAENNFVTKFDHTNLVAEQENRPDLVVADPSTAGAERALRQGNDKLAAYREANPNDSRVKTYSEMWGGVKQDNQENMAAYQKIQSRESLAGAAGDFIGTMVSAMDPNVNFLNTLTALTGGATKLPAVVAENVAIGAATETALVFGPVARNQELLGTETTLGEKVRQIGITAVASGLIPIGIKGIGVTYTGTTKGIKALENKINPVRGLARELRKSAKDYDISVDNLTAFEATGLSLKPAVDITVAQQAARAAAHREAVTRVTNPYGHANPGAVGLQTAKQAEVIDRIAKNFGDELLGGVRMPDGNTAKPKITIADLEGKTKVIPTIAEANGSKEVMERARNIDPMLINNYERQRMVQDTYNNWLHDADARVREVDELLQSARADVDALKQAEASRKLGGKARKASDKRIAKAEASLEAKRQNLMVTDTPQLAAIREKQTALDLEMRGAAERVSEVFRAAREQTDAMSPKTKPNFSGVGRQAVDQFLDNRALDETRPMKSLMDIIDPHKLNGKTFSDFARDRSKVLDATDPLVDAAVEKAHADFIGAEGEKFKGLEGDTIDIDGVEVNLNEKIFASELDKEGITIRDFLNNEAKADNDLTLAVTTCGRQ